MADYRKGYGATSAPLIVKDLVISATSGGDEGVCGFIDAYKASTGEVGNRRDVVLGDPGVAGEPEVKLEFMYGVLQPLRQDVHLSAALLSALRPLQPDCPH
jgi:hypothetical protein